MFALTEGNFTGHSLDVGGITFKQLIQDGAENYVEQIEEISGAAQGEKQIEDTMTSIKEKWDATYFVVAQYRDTKDRFIVKEVEEVITLLEDDTLTVSTMMGSKHVNEIRDEVEEWEKKLGYISDVIDEWLTF